jgi:hypothetical protein
MRLIRFNGFRPEPIEPELHEPVDPHEPLERDPPNPLKPIGPIKPIELVTCGDRSSLSSRGLGRRPFKAVTRVRIPSGTPAFNGPPHIAARRGFSATLKRNTLPGSDTRDRFALPLRPPTRVGRLLNGASCTHDRRVRIGDDRQALDARVLPTRDRVLLIPIHSFLHAEAPLRRTPMAHEVETRLECRAVRTALAGGSKASAE